MCTSGLQCFVILLRSQTELETEKHSFITTQLILFCFCFRYLFPTVVSTVAAYLILRVL